MNQKYKDSIKSVKETRKIRTASRKRHASTTVDDARLDSLRCLLDRKIIINLCGDNKAIIRKEATIVKLYPHMALAKYQVGKEDGPKHDLYAGLSLADLIEARVITCVHGRPEVVL